MLRQAKADIEGELTARIGGQDSFKAVEYSFISDVQSFVVAGFSEDGRSLYFSFGDKNIKPGIHKISEQSKISVWYNAGAGYSWIALQDEAGELEIKEISFPENPRVDFTFHFNAKQFQGDDTVLVFDGAATLRTVAALATTGTFNAYVKDGPSFSADTLYFFSAGSDFTFGGESSKDARRGVFFYLDFFNIEERSYDIAEGNKVYAWYNPGEAHASWPATQGTLVIKSFSLAGRAYIKFDYQLTAMDRIGGEQVNISGSAELTGFSRKAP